MSQELGGRRGAVFSVRVTPEERARLEALALREGPRSLGPWLLWRALGDREGTTAPASAWSGTTRSSSAWSGTTRSSPLERVVPELAAPAPVLPLQVRAAPALPPVERRTILDLCAGSGAWSEPYKRAGYRVVRVTLPKRDVRTFVSPAARVWGVLAAPPCNEFSRARNGAGRPRDLAAGMDLVNACLRIVLQTRPRWWALENPVGALSMFLGTPRDTFEPCDFGDPWTKRTALWGEFALPARGPFVKPATGKLRLVRSPADRAVTPPGFARAFFDANP